MTFVMNVTESSRVKMNPTAGFSGAIDFSYSCTVVSQNRWQEKVSEQFAISQFSPEKQSQKYKQSISKLIIHKW